MVHTFQSLQSTNACYTTLVPLLYKNFQESLGADHQISDMVLCRCVTSQCVRCSDVQYVLETGGLNYFHILGRDCKIYGLYFGCNVYSLKKK